MAIARTRPGCPAQQAIAARIHDHAGARELRDLDAVAVKVEKDGEGVGEVVAIEKVVIEVIVEAEVVVVTEVVTEAEIAEAELMAAEIMAAEVVKRPGMEIRQHDVVAIAAGKAAGELRIVNAEEIIVRERPIRVEIPRVLQPIGEIGIADAAAGEAVIASNESI